ncbi:MAG TPA: helix-turn-helix domain-containing protein [Pyrinomonadaceae bacterium]|jgi:transcriptional regulator with XRE-family HTH domain
MTTRKLSSLGVMVREKRGDAKLRDTAEAIGISAPTLMRIEAGRTPDVATFGKICQWLQISPESFLGYKQEDAPKENTNIQISAHLKAPKAMTQETISALARMILIAVDSQKSSEELTDENT